MPRQWFSCRYQIHAVLAALLLFVGLPVQEGRAQQKAEEESTGEVYARSFLKTVGCAAEVIPAEVPLLEQVGSLFVDTGENANAVIGETRRTNGDLEFTFEDPETEEPLTDINGDPLSRTQFFEIGGCTVVGTLVKGPSSSFFQPIVSYEKELLDRFDRAFEFYVKDPVPVQEDRLKGCGSHDEEGRICMGLTAGVYETFGTDTPNGWLQMTGEKVVPDSFSTVSSWGGPIRARLVMQFGGAPIYSATVNLKELTDQDRGQISLLKLPYSSYKHIRSRAQNETLSVKVILRDVGFVGAFSGSEGTEAGTFTLTKEGTVFPPEPPSLSASAGENSITLSLGGQADQYALFRSTTSGFTPKAENRIATTSSATYTDAENLVAGRQYYYKAISISTNGKSSNPSREVAAQIQSAYRITGLGASTNEAVAYSQATLDGRVETLDGDPVVGASVTLSIPEIEWTAGDLVTGEDGTFQTQYRVPGKPRTYQLRITARSNSDARKKKQSLVVSPRPEWGRDLALSNFSVVDSLVESGDTIQTELGVFNHSEQEETATLTYSITDRQGNEVHQKTEPVVLGTGSSKTISKSISLGAQLPDGSYQIRASIKNEDNLDQEPSNNTASEDIYVGSDFTSPTYRTQHHFISGLGKTAEIDGRTVTFTDFTSSSVTFQVDGESTGELSLDAKEKVKWISSAEDFLLLPESFEQSDSTVTFEAGRSTTASTVSPSRLQIRRTRPSSFAVRYRQGETPTPSDITFPFGPDSDSLNQWIGNVGDDFADARTAELGIQTGRTATLRDHRAWMQWDDETYTFYKEVSVRPRPIHDLELADVSVESIVPQSQSSIPDFIPGATVRVSGEVQNKGDFHEEGAVSVVVRNNEDKVIFTERLSFAVDSLDLSAQRSVESSTFSVEWPTVGLPANTDYTVSIKSPHATDETPGNNQHTTNITLVNPPQLDVEVQTRETPVEVGSQVRAVAFVGRGNESISDASVAGTLLFPDGTERGVNLTYNAEKQVYESTFYANFGGNYRLDVQAERTPYRPGHARDIIAKAYVDVSAELQEAEVDIAKNAIYQVRTSNVAGLHAASVDVLYDAAHVSHSKTAETVFLNRGGSVETSLQQSDRGDRVIAGLTRLGQTEGATSTRGSSLLSFAFTATQVGSSSFSLENAKLADPHGEPMAVRVESGSSQVSIVEKPVTLSLSAQDTVQTSTERDTAWINMTGAYRLKGVEATLSTSPEKLQVIDVIEGEALSDSGDVETLLVEDIKEETGEVTFALTRTGRRPGITITSKPVVGIVHDPIASGDAPINVDGAKVISSYEDLTLPRNVRNTTFVIEGEDEEDSGPSAPDEPPLSPHVELSPDTTRGDEEEIVETVITVSEVEDLASFAADLSYDDGQLSLVEVVEGPLLSEGGSMRTSLVYEARPDTVVIGLSQLEEEGRGVTVGEQDTLCTVRFRRSDVDSTNVGFHNVKLLRAGGTPVDSVSASDTLHVKEGDPAPPDEEPTLSPRIGLSPDTARADEKEIVETIITASEVEDLASFAADLSYDDEQLSLVEVVEGPLLSEGGSMRTSLVYEARPDTVVIGLAQLEEEGRGVTAGEQDTLCTARFRRSDVDSTNVGLHNVEALQSDGMPIDSVTASDTLHVEEGDPAPPDEVDATTLAFSPARAEAGKDSTFTVAVTIDDVENLFSVATDLTYDPSQLTLDDATEGNFLSKDSVDTSFTVQIDNESGIAIIGLSRLGDDVGSVGTSEPDTLLTATFTREDTERAALRLVNTGLLQPDGITRIPFTAKEGTVLNAPPSAPMELSADSSGANIQLRWTGVEISDLDRYRIYRDTAPIDSASGPAVQVPLDSTVAEDTTYVDTTADLGTTYHYRVTAVDTSASESGFSGEASVRIPLPGVALFDGREGMGYQAPMPEPGTENNPVGRFVLRADRAGAVLSSLTVENDGSTARDVDVAELWRSSNPVFGASEDSLIASDSSAVPATFSEIGLSLPSDSVYVFLVLDLTEKASGSYTPVLESEEALALADGTLEAVNGASGNTFTDAYLSADPAVLPVELASFGARTTSEAATLTWTTASETNNAGFTVQHREASAPGVHRADTTGQWTKRGFVESKVEGGTTTEAQKYRYEAKRLDIGTHQFRLRQVDTDGTAHRSEPITVEVTMKEAYRLTSFPNPARRQATVELAAREKQDVRVVLYDILGRRVSTLHNGPVPAEETTEFTLEADHLANGTYFLRLVGEKGTRTSRLMIVQ